MASEAVVDGRDFDADVDAKGSMQMEQLPAEFGTG